MLDADNLKAILAKYEEVSKANRPSRIAISKAQRKLKVKTLSSASLIKDLVLLPTIVLAGKEYALFKSESGWYLYRGDIESNGSYHWFAVFSKESDGKPYAAKPFHRFRSVMARIEGKWLQILAGNVHWVQNYGKDEDEIDWELYRKPIYEIVDKNFFKRKPSAE